MMSGTHGTEDGVSALTDIDRNDVTEGYVFYQEDCSKVGIKAGPRRTDQRPPLSARRRLSGNYNGPSVLLRGIPVLACVLHHLRPGE